MADSVVLSTLGHGDALSTSHSESKGSSTIRRDLPPISNPSHTERGTVPTPHSTSVAHSTSTSASSRVVVHDSPSAMGSRRFSFKARHLRSLAHSKPNSTRRAKLQRLADIVKSHGSFEHWVLGGSFDDTGRWGKLLQCVGMFHRNGSTFLAILYSGVFCLLWTALILTASTLSRYYLHQAMYEHCSATPTPPHRSCPDSPGALTDHIRWHQVWAHGRS